MSSACVLTAVGEDLEDLAGDVALQTSHDFAGAESFSAAACDVDAGAFVAAHPDEDDPPGHCCVGARSRRSVRVT